MLTETIDTHTSKLLEDVNVSTVQQVEQAIKSLCALVARAETVEIRSSLMQLRAASKTQPPQPEAVRQAVAAITEGRTKLLRLYSRATNQVKAGRLLRPAGCIHSVDPVVSWTSSCERYSG
jgi:hypothetical protein